MRGNITIRELAALMIELYEELTGSPARSRIETVAGDEFYGEGSWFLTQTLRRNIVAYVVSGFGVVVWPFATRTARPSAC